MSKRKIQKEEAHDNDYINYPSYQLVLELMHILCDI